MALGQQFERDIVKAFNDFFTESGVNGYAYRLKQTKFVPQDMDILVDSLNRHYYLGIECKSRTINKNHSGLFFDDNIKNQVSKQVNFLAKTGRKGYFAVEYLTEVVSHQKRKRTTVLIPHGDIYKLILAGHKVLTIEDILKYPVLQYAQGRYKIPEELQFYAKRD